MEKAQWSPINSDRSTAAWSPANKKHHQGLTSLPINFSNGTPLRAKKHHIEPPKHNVDSQPAPTNPTPNMDLSASPHDSRSSKPRDMESVCSSPLNRTDPPTPSTTISRGASTSERRVESKNNDMASNARNPTSIPNSRAGTQTPKADHQAAVAVVMNGVEPQKHNQIQSAKEIYQAFNIPPPDNDQSMSERQSKDVRMGKPSLVVRKNTPRPRDTPAVVTSGSSNEPIAESHQSHVKPVQDHQPVEVEEQSSSSSDDDAANLPADANPTAEKAHGEVHNPLVDNADDVTMANGLPDDHPIEWLAEARNIYQHTTPPFVTKQKQGIRRMVELPLAEGQQYPGKVEVVYRSWDAEHTFASIDKGGQRFIIKAFRGGPTPYRPWLGPQTGFSETALAFAKQGPRGSRSWTVTKDKRLSLPKGWALEEEDENDDDDYSLGNRRESSPGQGRQRPVYEVNGEEEEVDDDQREDTYQILESLQTERSLMEGDYLVPGPTGDRRAHSMSDTQPPSKLINAVKKSLRLPKEQDAFPRPRQIKRRSIGGQGQATDSKGDKRKTHKAVFSSDSENPTPRKKAKATKAVKKAIHRSLSTNSVNLKNVTQALDFDPPPLDAETLSSYKQAHTTLRITLVPYPQQCAVQRLRSCMNIAAFFSTVIGVSGYKGDRDRIFGITATFDSKPNDDPDRSMVIREEWQDNFDIFLEMIDGAESWTKDGGKCSVSVGLLLTEG